MPCVWSRPGPDQDELDEVDRRDAPEDQGQIVLVEQHIIVPVTVTENPLRRTTTTFAGRCIRPTPTPAGPPANVRAAAQTPPDPSRPGSRAIAEAIDAMLVLAQPCASTTPAATTVGSRPSATARTTPRNDSNRRPAQRGLRANLEAPCQRHAGEAGIHHRRPNVPRRSTSYNAISEIPGTDSGMR